jgi:GT2 family glycosyltransferase
MEVEAKAAPKVTALIVSHNNAPALRKCLDALQKSNNRDQLEILVVDNGSWDESPRLDTEFPGVTFLRMPRNFGRTKALNIGIRTAAGELLFFLSPHVLVHADTVGKLVDHLGAADDATVAVCPSLRGAAGELVNKCYPFPTASALFSAWVSDAPLAAEPPPVTGDAAPVAWTNLDAMLVRKYFVKGINYFDERYGEYLADAELSFQVRRAGKKILLLGQLSADVEEPEPVTLGEGPRALLSADFLSGVTTFAGKHGGFLSSMFYRLRAILLALGSMLAFRDLGYRGRRFLAVAGMRKVDGSQTEAI